MRGDDCGQSTEDAVANNAAWGVIKGLPQLVDQIDQGVRRGALPAATQSLQVVRAKLGNDAGVVGAAILALHTFKNED